LDGKYRVDSLVAEGGFGVVYRGVHLRLKKPVAIKVLKLQHLESDRLRAAVMAQFEAEAETIAKLDHPAVVRVLDFGIAPMPDGAEAPWMALEWMNGVTLAEDLRARRDEPGRSPKEVLAMLRPALSALAKAHAMGIAHRDLKPANLMLSPRREGADWAEGEVPVKILDFGIAKEMPADEQAVASGQTVTKAAFAAFSLRYATPEQVTGTRTGPWTDVYQMATVITELLTNRPPYQGDDAIAVHMQIMAPWRLTPARFNVDVGAWEAVLTRALAVMPAERYANAKELLDELTARLPAEDQAPERVPGPPEAVSVAPDVPVDRAAMTLSPATTSARVAPRSTRRWWLLAVASGLLLAGGLSLRAFTRMDKLARTLAVMPAPVATPVVAPAPEPVARQPEPAPSPQPLPISEVARDGGTAVLASASPDSGVTRRVRPRPRPTVLVDPLQVE
jgi:serine/threonine-protein kinase